uniref:Uncharacterized protein n=1 Tax=Leersia perrieri TaxID=77586 RepID=A0A0D9XMR0_9ORYZ
MSGGEVSRDIHRLLIPTINLAPLLHRAHHVRPLPAAAHHHEQRPSGEERELSGDQIGRAMG